MPPYVPHLFQYRFQPGEKQAFRQTSSMVMHDPQQGTLTGQIVHDFDYLVLADSPHGGWEIHMVRTTVSKSGPLANDIPAAELEERKINFRLAPDGSPFDLGYGLPPRKPVFPREPVGLGDSWNCPETVSRNGLPPLTVTYQIVVLEERQGDLQADLAAMAQTQQADPAGPIQVEVAGTVTFSLKRGKLVRSLTRIDMTWPSITPETERPVRRRTELAIDLQPR